MTRSNTEKYIGETSIKFKIGTNEFYRDLKIKNTLNTLVYHWNNCENKKDVTNVSLIYKKGTNLAWLVYNPPPSVYHQILTFLLFLPNQNFMNVWYYNPFVTKRKWNKGIKENKKETMIKFRNTNYMFRKWNRNLLSHIKFRFLLCFLWYNKFIAITKHVKRSGLFIHRW